MRVFPAIGATGFEGPGLGAGSNSGANVYPNRILVGGVDDPLGETTGDEARFLGGILADPAEREAVLAELKDAGLPEERVMVHDPASTSLARELADLGVPEGELAVYEDHARKGGGLLTVQVRSGGEAATVREVFKRHHTEDVSAVREP